MRTVVQRVLRASVSVDGKVVGNIGPGLLVFLAAANEDGPEQVRWMTEKLTGLRIFSDEKDKMNLNVVQVRGEILIISQFTLYGDCRKGKRPSYTHAAPPEPAVMIYEQFINEVARTGIPVQKGIFGAMMAIDLVNDGPVTLIIDSP